MPSGILRVLTIGGTLPGAIRRSHEQTRRCPAHVRLPAVRGSRRYSRAADRPVGCAAAAAACVGSDCYCRTDGYVHAVAVADRAYMDADANHHADADCDLYADRYTHGNSNAATYCNTTATTYRYAAH